MEGGRVYVKLMHDLYDPKNLQYVPIVKVVNQNKDVSRPMSIKFVTYFDIYENEYYVGLYYEAL